ncbi:MAG: hypothetical protein ACRDJ4_09990 [Actinomycetota bacterium]
MYMVVFTSAEGRSGYHHADELEEAVRFVERMRNGEGVTDAKLYRMTEIPLEVKAYYKVEIASASGKAPSPIGAQAGAHSVSVG